VLCTALKKKRRAKVGGAIARCAKKLKNGDRSGKLNMGEEIWGFLESGTPLPTDTQINDEREKRREAHNPKILELMGPPVREKQKKGKSYSL